ncbi:hypothetical protein L249_0159 [Ophiocordyceps polyrhachis-furcata BCC 54312]|uniref:Xylanolytic transcriptional activator regulatory domain-containing protein n=1 Tax=Ophiocordyceps polyrhachis-furcata BCC 54312 TaxID=1330021 RepID=A0A367LCP5_9HYPO|nr:hypothetical protein L249_0159 [Ophiocordyceps polyrhachis-furcata BCC 54312]
MEAVVGKLYMFVLFSSITPTVKASLVLSFEFLRLYINAFAFQATLNRAVARASQRASMKAQMVSNLFSDVAGNPDARFIYESIDAANSLLSILNSFIDPVAGLKCMPLKYCLYVIYAAVFLFKARLAGAISGEGDGGVRRAIQGTITQLQKTSTNPHSLGRRYATSLRLLWRKSSPAKHKNKTNARPETTVRPPLTPAQGALTRIEDMPRGDKAPLELDPLNGFSWRDLDSLGQYIASNSTMAAMGDGMLTSAEFDWEHSSAGLDDLAMRPQNEAVDSDGVSGGPPCRRCVEHQLQCVLAKSRRGGRRIKGVKGALPPNPARSVPVPVPPSSSSSHPVPPPGDEGEDDDEDDEDDEDDDEDDNADDIGRHDAYRHHASSAHGCWPSPQSAHTWRAESPAGSVAHDESSRRDSDGLEGHIASTDLLNPSDALDLLAQVADLDPGGRHGGSSGRDGAARRSSQVTGDGAAASPPAYFAPIADGVLTWLEASFLVKRYHDEYHPFFPVAYSSIFDGRPVSEWAEKEPHLLTAILTVASKDDPSWSRVHEACSQFMESLVTKLIHSGSTNIGSVEALLILAEWAPQRSNEYSTIGCGQEDNGAWMLVGMAIRLGYLQRLEQTALVPENGSQSVDVSRKRIAWAACYMSDRQVSIRLGKGFWSRGPIPSISWRAADFPSLQNQALGPDNLALLFQAQLELIQLFITPTVKASLVLSFEFLRLYINAFAFQATLNRAVARASQRASMKAQMVSNLFSDVAGNPDARFIYESIDAANSLLSILNSFIDPVAGLKCMPLKYCLYVIYAADDFASVLRKWKLSWANFTPTVKASLVLSFEFLRLYINAFAFQATLNRAVARASQRASMKAQMVSNLFSDVAGNPDARFIYESIDAANSLLSILNSFIDPVAGLKCMPLKYCLYVIYAAVFLFKARLAGAISGEGDGGVRRAIQGTITQLQKTSTNPHSLGRRYATSLRLLWRKSSPAKHKNKTSARPETTVRPPLTPAQGALTRIEDMPRGDKAPLELDPLNGFSWRDLDSLGQYIASNSTMAAMGDGMLTSAEFDWEHSSAGLDDLAMRPQNEAVWSGHDIIF